MPKLEYSEQGRDGYVIYKDEISTLKFYYEFGGGNCVVIISVPSASKWESQTKRSLSERETILKFVGEQATKDQVKNGYYQLKEGWIEIFTKG